MENNYIHEYVEYYYNLGFDKIFLYDNNDIDGEKFEDVIKEYIDNNFVELINYRGEKVCQLRAYQDCYDKHNKEYDWMAFFDCDEFLVTNSNNIHDYLSQECFNNFQMIHVNWLIYDDNGLVKYENKPLQERFNTFKTPISFRRTYNFPENFHIKTIIKGKEKIKWVSTPHTPISNCKCCNGIGQECQENSPFNVFNYDGAYLKHFLTKTIEEWINNKMKRGYPDQDDNASKKNTNIEKFFLVNKRTKEKEIILKELENEQ